MGQGRRALLLTLASVVALAALAAGDGVALAPTAQPGAAKLGVSRTAALPGERIRLSGRGFAPASRVRLLFAGRLLKRVRAGRRGRFRTRFTVPQRAAGSYRLEARFAGGRVRLRFRVLVLPDPPEQPLPDPVPPPAPPQEPPPEPQPEPLTLVAAGDIACRPDLSVTAERCRQAGTAQRTIALAPDAVATLGDAQYENGELANYLASYDPTWGAFKSITRPATGNHEYQGDPERDSAPGHFGYFGAAAGDPSEGYYSYELGSWTIFALNSGSIDYTRTGGGAALPDDCWPVSCAAGSPQESWLRDSLAELPDDACVIGYWHHPLISSGWGGLPRDHPEVQPLYDALYDNGAELALTGHAHNYERFAPVDAAGVPDPAGVREFVVGTGGRNLFTDPSLPRPTSERLETAFFGVLELTLSEQAYSFRFVAEDGSVVDQGSGACQDRPG
jgi:acid phosphatase type 7